ncbi:hypothetical protein CJF32_00010448 [Rutstroemia sp. NJR-2017a WRK4]|nr:hypothetical protein CJF32_00010448 [Rutstroemia sp. NJR-2017a WRK4]
MTSNASVLLTGATGSVGASLLEQLLAANYKVYTVLRSAKKSQPFLEKKYPQHVKNNTLEFIEIPDMTVAGAFDDGASKVTYIIHVATPLSYSNFQEEMITPASIVDHNILTAAHKSTTVKRVVVTGSVVSVMYISRDLMAGKTFTEEDFNPIPLEDALQSVAGAYSYSKVTSEKLAWEFMKKEKPNFDLVVLLAPSITGRCIQEGFVPDKKSLGGMGAIYALFDNEELGFIYPWTMDVDDVAAVHVKSLKESTPGNQRYVFHIGEPLTAAAVAQKIREEYPQLKDRVPAPKPGSDVVPDSLSRFDTSKSDAVFGTEWKDWWESVKATVDDILKYEK